MTLNIQAPRGPGRSSSPAHHDLCSAIAPACQTEFLSRILFQVCPTDFTIFSWCCPFLFFLFFCCPVHNTRDRSPASTSLVPLDRFLYPLITRSDILRCIAPNLLLANTPHQDRAQYNIIKSTTPANK